MITHSKKQLVCMISALSAGMLLAPQFAAAQQASGATLEEVIVTAQKRDENVQDVPITIAAITPGQLEAAGFNSVNDLQALVPALRIDYAGAFSQPTVRGVGSSIAGVGFSSNIATYVDGFYIPSQLSSDMQLINLQGVQVLKGPQGTLFGRNATGAAILVTMLDPTPAPTLTVKASYENYNHSNLSAYGSIGLTDDFAVDISGYQEQSDGYIDNIYTGSDTDGEVDRKGARASAVWNVTDDFSAKLALEHHDWDDGTANSTGSFEGLAVGTLLAPLGVITATEPHEVSNDLDTGFTAEIDAAFLTLRADLGFAEFASYTMSRKEETEHMLDLDSSSTGLFNASFATENDSFSQEFNLSGSAFDDKLDWIVGAYYLTVEEVYPDFLVSSPAQFMTPAWFSLYNVGSDVESYAIFTDETFNFNDNWSLTVGLRYSSESADGVINIHPGLLQNPAFGGLPAGETKFSDSWSSVTKRGVLAYKPSDESKVYFSVSEGFKAGQVSPSSLLDPATLQPFTVKPENITAYELGYKFADRAFRFDAAAFFYDYKDMQVATYNNVAALVSNAATSEVYGAESQISVAMSEEWSANLGVAWVHGEYVSYPGAAYFEQDPGTGSFPPATSDASGNQMQRSPRFTGNLGVQYEASVGYGRVRVNADYSITSSFYFDPSNQYYQEGYGLFGMSAAWTDPSEHWTLALYGKNLTDEEYRSQVLPGTMAIQQTYGEPITYGASVTFKY